MNFHVLFKMDVACTLIGGYNSAKSREFLIKDSISADIWLLRTFILKYRKWFDVLPYFKFSRGADSAITVILIWHSIPQPYFKFDLVCYDTCCSKYLLSNSIISESWNKSSRLPITVSILCIQTNVHISFMAYLPLQFTKQVISNIK